MSIHNNALESIVPLGLISDLHSHLSCVDDWMVNLLSGKYTASWACGMIVDLACRSSAVVAVAIGILHL